MEKQDSLGPYRLLRELASDAMGAVYEALEPESNQRRVAVRSLATQAPSENLRARVLAAKGLRHPNIVEVLGGGREGTTAYVVTELLDAETLAQYLARAGRIPPLQGLALAAQLLSALAFAHERGLRHGAVCPQHLLVTRAGELKLDGLGWAIAQEAVEPDYRAPEQISDASVDHRADLYSAALVAYELLAGARPFGGKDDRLVPRAVAEARAELPAKLDTVFQRALEPDPQTRYQTAADMWAALQAVLEPPLWVRPRVPVAAVRAKTPTQPLPCFPGLSPSLLARRIALTFGVACTVLVGWMTGVNGEQPGLPMQATVAETQEAAVAPVPKKQASTLASTLVQPSPAPPVAEALVPVPAAATLEPQPLVTPTESEAVKGASDSPPAPVLTHAVHTREAAAPQGSARPASKRVAANDGTIPRPVVRASARRGPKPALPRLGCRQDLLIAREFCTALRCATPEFRKHPVCMRMYADQRDREKYAKTFGGN